MSFYVGQKVVCVDATSPAIRAHPAYKADDLTHGHVYTVSRVKIDEWESVLVLQLVELPTRHPNQIEIFYQAARFRPVVERKTDISIFTDMLIPSEIEGVKEIVKAGES